MFIDRQTDRSWLAFTILIVLAFALRLMLAERLLARGGKLFPDSELYMAYAETLFEGKNYSADGHLARRTPGYPLFIAGCWSVGGKSDRAILWGQALAGTVTCILIFRLATQLSGSSFPATSRWPALLLGVLDPYAVALTGLVLSETVSATLIMLASCLWLACARRSSLLSAALLGVTCALLVLVRPSALLLLPFALCSWYGLRRGERGTWIAIAVTVVSCAVVLSPWWIRNAAVFGRFVPTTLNVGESLYDGVGPQATGASDTSFAETPALRALPEPERDAHWFRESISELQRSPGRVCKLAFLKILRFWSPWPNEMSFQQPLVIVLTTLGTVPVWIFAAYGIWKNRRRADVVASCVGPILYFCILHALFVSSVRYRAPVSGLICVLAGAGVAVIWDGRRRWVPATG